jgi:toxin HigB-1
MPLQLSFLNEALKEICEQQRAGDFTLGSETARKLRARLADIQAATDMSDLPVGQPTENPWRPERLAIMLSNASRLEVEVANRPVPKNRDGTVQWVKVTKIQIVAVGGNDE